MPKTEWQWLASTKQLQEEYFGKQFDGLTDDEIVTRLKDELLAAIVELIETTGEFKWKYWATEPPWLRRTDLIEELVDVHHFTANMLVTLGVTDEEWAAAYQRKQDINRRRHTDGGYVSRQATKE